MTIEKDGGPAFGQVVDLRCVRVEMDGRPEWEPHVLADSGMRLRDYFAAKAMVALITEPKWCDGHTPLVAEIGPKGVLGAGRYASAAYAMADAMLKARKK